MFLNLNSIVLVVIVISLSFMSSYNCQSSNGPNFCSEHILDSAYSDHKNQILVTKDRWLWTFIEGQPTIFTANRLEPTERYKLQSILYISAIPECDLENRQDCADIRWAKNLIIMTYKLRRIPFDGAYQLKKVVNGVITNLNHKTYIPFGLKPKGNMFSTEESFWPKDLAKNADHFDKKHLIVFYNPFEYKVIILVNSKTKGRLCFNEFHQSSNNWTDSWKCRSVRNDWKFVGAFLKRRSIYVLAIKESDNRLFTISKNHELMDTNIDVQNYFECNPNKAALRSQFGSIVKDKSEDSSPIVWVIIGFVVILLVVVVFAFIAFCSTRKSTNPTAKTLTPKPASPPLAIPASPTPKPVTPKPAIHKPPINEKKPKMLDDRGREVEENQIGALDSKVNWDIIVAQPSIADSDEPVVKPNKQTANPSPAPTTTPGAIKKKT